MKVSPVLSEKLIVRAGLRASTRREMNPRRCRTRSPHDGGWRLAQPIGRWCSHHRRVVLGLTVIAAWAVPVLKAVVPPLMVVFHEAELPLLGGRWCRPRPEDDGGYLAVLAVGYVTCWLVAESRRAESAAATSSPTSWPHRSYCQVPLPVLAVTAIEDVTIYVGGGEAGEDCGDQGSDRRRVLIGACQYIWPARQGWSVVDGGHSDLEGLRRARVLPAVRGAAVVSNPHRDRRATVCIGGRGVGEAAIGGDGRKREKKRVVVGWRMNSTVCEASSSGPARYWLPNRKPSEPLHPRHSLVRTLCEGGRFVGQVHRDRHRGHIGVRLPSFAL